MRRELKEKKKEKEKEKVLSALKWLESTIKVSSSKNEGRGRSSRKRQNMLWKLLLTLPIYS